jgi:serine/threonine protein kinase
MVIEQAPPKHVTEQLMPLEALQADEALSLPDQDSPPPETRMFGSSRFMAPEEFELGAPIDERTTVFTMGRSALVLLAGGDRAPAAFRAPSALYEVVARATTPDRAARYGSMAEFYAAWRAARA